MNILEAMADLALFVSLALGPFLGRPTTGPWTAGRANAPERRHTPPAPFAYIAIYAALPVFNLCRGNCLSSSRAGRPNQCRLMSSALNLSRMIPKLSEQPERTS